MFFPLPRIGIKKKQENIALKILKISIRKAFFSITAFFSKYVSIQSLRANQLQCTYKNKFANDFLTIHKYICK